jgi:hypothetical protein
MALPSKTIELIEEIAEKLDRWAKGWGKQLLKDRPHNLSQLRESLLADLGNTDFPHLTFRIEFYSGLKEALEKCDHVLETLHQYMPNMVKLVQKKYDDVIAEAESVVQLTVGSCDWLKELNNSRNHAISLARTLRHVAEIAGEDLALEKPGEIEQKSGPIKEPTKESIQNETVKYNRHLTKAQRVAYHSYEYATSEKPTLAEAKDDDVYDWLKENAFPEYELPSRETWKRYVRHGRKADNKQKNIPRTGRTGRSIVKASQIEYTSSQKPD